MSNSGEETNIPDHWTEAKLGKVVDILDSERDPINSTERQKRLEDSSEKYPYYGATGQVGWIDDYLFDEELVLLGEDGAPFLEPYREVAYMINGKTWVNNHAHVLRAKEGITTNRFLMHYLNTVDYHDYVTGTTRLKLNQGRMKEIPVFLPPLPEQRRIVAKIEELFTNLDAGRSDLATAEQQLERYRRSVLQAAVEGRLTADWRRTHDPEPADRLLERILEKRREQWEEDYRAKYEAKGKEPPSGWKSRYSKPDDPNTNDLPDLPDGWIWTNIENVCIVYGGVTKNARKGGDLVEMPYLRVANVYANELRLDEIKKIKVKRNRLYKYFLEEGDLLVVEGNGSKSQIGRVARWDGSIDPCVHQNHLFKVRPMLQQMGHYLLWWMLSPNGRSYITKVASSTSGLYTLSMTKIRSLPVPLPPVTEQKQIVNEVERLLSVADDAAATTEREKTRAERLRQSILKQAFSGRLVPHGDEEAPSLADASSTAAGSSEEQAVPSTLDAGSDDDLLDGIDESKQIEMDL